MSVLLGIGLFFAGSFFGVCIMAVLNAASADRRCEECPKGGCG